MECNCNNNNSNGGVIPWVRGNRLPLIICVYENVVTQEQVGDSTLTVNEMTRVPYTIQDNDTVTVIMKSGFRQVAMPFTTDGNKVMVTDNGELPTGAYTVEVTIERGDGARGRWQETRQVRIYENTSEAQLGEMYSIDADLFFYAKGDTGTGIADITNNPDGTLTITMTDGTSYTTEALKGDKGDKGDTGERGVSIVSFDVTGQTDVSVIYTVTFSDDTTQEVAVPKGPQGDTETDPVFNASAAASITSADITAWNGKSTFSGSYNDLTDKPTLFSGDYNDLSNKPTIPTVPTNVSAFNNDAGYLTQHQDISGKADKSEMSVTDGTGAGADKTTITLKSGTSATVLKSHQDISGKQDALVSGTNIKTINNESVLGSGNISVAAELPSNLAYTSNDNGEGIIPSDGIRTVTVTSAATMTINPDVVTVIDGAVGTSTITLAVPQDNLAHVWDILLTTDSTVAITFAMSNSATILTPSGFSIGASKAVEISVIGVGTKYYLRYGEFA